MKLGSDLTTVDLYLHDHNYRSCDIIDHPRGTYVAWVPYSL